MKKFFDFALAALFVVGWLVVGIGLVHYGYNLGDEMPEWIAPTLKVVGFTSIIVNMWVTSQAVAEKRMEEE